MSKKTALVTGATGQDASYLFELLLEKGYEVHGIVRRSSSINTARIDHIFEPESKEFIHWGHLTEGITELIYQLQPDEIYNLAAMSHVKVSFDTAVYTGDVVGLGAARILEAIRHLDLTKKTKFYQASSSEMFGISPPPQNENTPFQPVSPYGCAKLYAYHMTKSYRSGYGMFASNGILFNHESPRRGETFVTRKITKAVAKIHLGLQKSLKLGNLDALRDWGHSKDYMRAIYMIMQHEVPDDFVVSTGQYHSVKEFLDIAFKYVDKDPGDYVIIDESYKRPNEVPALLGDSTKIRKVLGWEPQISFEQLVKEMIDNDIEQERKKQNDTV